MTSKPKRYSNNADLMRYAGLSAQILASLGVAVFVGYKADGWIKTPFPIFIWSLPLVVLLVLFYQLIKQTSKQKKGDAEK